MRALTYDPHRDRFQVADLPIPRPGDADVLVQGADQPHRIACEKLLCA